MLCSPTNPQRSSGSRSPAGRFGATTKWSSPPRFPLLDKEGVGRLPVACAIHSCSLPPVPLSLASSGQPHHSTAKAWVLTGSRESAKHSSREYGDGAYIGSQRDHVSRHHRG